LGNFTITDDLIRALPTGNEISLRTRDGKTRKEGADSEIKWRAEGPRRRVAQCHGLPENRFQAAKKRVRGYLRLDLIVIRSVAFHDANLVQRVLDREHDAQCVPPCSRAESALTRCCHAWK